MVEIIVKSTHSEKRTRDFFKFHLFKVSPMRYVYFSIATIFLVISIVLYFLMKFQGSLFFLFLSLMVLFIRIASTNILVNKVVKNVVFPSLNYKLVFNDNEIIYSYEMFKKVYKWSDLLFIYEINNYIFFYVGKNSSLILSKYILNEEERKSLQDIILRSNVKYKLKKFK